MDLSIVTVIVDILSILITMGPDRPNKFVIQRIAVLNRLEDINNIFMHKVSEQALHIPPAKPET